ncbi:MAG: peptidoglycan bridge formation glycyltransferase FemA/FemB family protein [Oscillospiraceae bacterium]|nr:peptidoglycan bridge formation glycyltransferase FemA/FemB family protein [Oscillospiraceae bacterium]
MIEYVTRENMADYERFVQSHPAGTFLQSSLWRQQKPTWRWRAMIRRDERGVVTGALALLIRRVPALPFTLVYGCRGPVCASDDRDTLRELLEAAREVGRRERAYVVRLDPPVPENRAYRELLSELGYAPQKHGKRYVPLQPTRLWRLELAGKPEDVPHGFDEETRQSIRIALQRGVEVLQGGRELTADFAALVQQTSVRETRVVRPADYYAGLMENFGSAARIFLAYYDGRPAAGALVITYGGRAVETFEADDGDITLRARYLLRTMILRQALEDGCGACEFPGLPEDPESPEMAFALGFGGEVVSYVGELDLILHRFVNFLAETAGALWLALRKRLYFWKNR